MKRYLTLGGGHLGKQRLRHLGPLHLVLNLLVDGGADVENAAVCPQHSVSAHWGQSGLRGATGRDSGVKKRRSVSRRFSANHKSGFLKVQTVKGTVQPKTTNFTLINITINSN